jgi:hypothetical protein
MNDLYLIGNGFDLAHGLKTSYNDFLLWYLNDSLRQYNKKTNFDDGLIKISHNGYFQDLNEDFISISNLFKWCKESDYFIKPQLPFLEKLLSSIRNCKWVDVEYEYYMALVDFYKRLEKVNLSRHENIDKELVRLNACLDSIKKKLVEYLMTIKVTSKLENRKIESILLEGTGSEDKLQGEKLFVNFNYTKTLELYTSRNFPTKNNLINIHGELVNPSNPIIFGYGDEMDPHYEKIENLNTNEFLRNIKSFGYFRTVNYQRVLKFIDGKYNPFTVKILGHSCGLSDRILLNTIFEHPKCKAIKIYYYQKNETENDYFEKTQEISRHFKAKGKADMRTKIVSFSQSVPLIPFVPNN